MRIAFVVLPLIALAACAPSEDGERERGGSPLPGLELAAVGSAEQTKAAQVSVIDLTVEDLQAKMAAGNLRLIDVRRDDEVAQGMIPGAEHIALDAFDPAALDLSDGREVVLYCRSGRRSGIAAERLAAHTGEAAQHLAGGYLAWVEASEPAT